MFALISSGIHVWYAQIDLFFKKKIKNKQKMFGECIFMKSKWSWPFQSTDCAICKISCILLHISAAGKMQLLRQIAPSQLKDDSDLMLTWSSLGRIHWSPWCYQSILSSRIDSSHELGWSKEEELRGVCSLHRRDAYPNTSTNSWDGDLVAQASVGTKTVWAQARDSSLFYPLDSGAASRGNPCLK